MATNSSARYGHHLQRYAAITFFAGIALLSALALSDLQKIRSLSAATGDKARAKLAEGLPRKADAATYQAYATMALSSQPLDMATLDLARRAAGEVVRRDPHILGAWNQLVFIDVARNRQLTKEGVAALIKSYEYSPYGDLSDMIWRVDFATVNWTSLPDELRAKTLGQIPVIGQFGISWGWRIKHCKGNPHPTLRSAICDIAPGVPRDAPLEPLDLSR